MTGRVIAKIGTRVKSLLVKRHANLPAIAVTDRDAAAIHAGTVFAGATFRKDTAIEAPAGGYVAGTDYVVHIVRGRPVARPMTAARISPAILGGFHFAPGGNAVATEGGDAIPAINPHSCWDRNFRPACPNPRGMTRVVRPDENSFWCDIYLLARDHREGGTSQFGVVIADGNNPPENLGGGYYKCCDFAAVTAVYKHHGKGLLSAEDFFAAAYGVKERSAAGVDPGTTKCDPPRTSRFGVMQATGNLLVWGTDGHPDDPRPSIFGGSWLYGSGAGSRFAGLGCWPENSGGALGARGRSDHLQLG